MALTDQQKLDSIKAAVDAAATPGTQPVSGTVAVSNFPETQGVAGVVAVSNLPPAPLTDAQLRAAAVPVSTGLAPLTDAQLRATPVPVSGALTDAQLRASPVPVPVRPSERAGHTAFQHHRTTAGQFRTIAATGYAVWLTVAATNSSTTSELLVLIQDNGVTVWSIVVPRTVVGNAPGAVALHVQFPEPLRFATDISVATSGGTLGALAVTVGGYEA